MKLILLRHAKAEQSLTKNDFDRNLSNKGKKQCVSIAKQFEQHLSKFRLHVFCSSANRTRQTCDRTLTNLALTSKTYHKSLYLTGWNELLQFITAYDHTFQDDQCLVLVGHNFGISDLLFQLTNEDITLKTGEAVIIDFPFDNSKLISRETGTLLKKFSPLLD